MIGIRVLICGDRNWSNFKVIDDFIKTLPEDTTIIEGDCRGVDKIAGYLAKKYGFVLQVYPADWKKHGKAAGPIRNRQMLDEGKPNLVIAFHNNIEKSKGTKNMINLARKAKIKTFIISERGIEYEVP